MKFESEKWLVKDSGSLKQNQVRVRYALVVLSYVVFAVLFFLARVFI